MARRPRALGKLNPARAVSEPALRDCTRSARPVSRAPRPQIRWRAPASSLRRRARGSSEPQASVGRGLSQSLRTSHPLTPGEVGVPLPLCITLSQLGIQRAGVSPNRLWKQLLGLARPHYPSLSEMCPTLASQALWPPHLSGTCTLHCSVLGQLPWCLLNFSASRSPGDLALKCRFWFSQAALGLHSSAGTRLKI